MPGPLQRRRRHPMPSTTRRRPRRPGSGHRCSGRPPRRARGRRRGRRAGSAGVCEAAATRPSLHLMPTSWPVVFLRVVGSRPLRHAARPHPGARQAGRRAGAARAAAAARRAAADRAGLGDRAAARAGRLRRPGRRAGPARPRGGGRAQRRPRRADPADARPAGRRGDPRACSPPSPSWRPGGDRPDAAGGAVDACRWTRTTSTRRYDPTRSPTTSPRRPRRRWCWPRSAPRTAAGRTPVNAWWGSFDLAVSLFSGPPAEPPSDDFIMRNAMDAQEVAVGWWPGDARYPRPRSTPTPTRRPTGFASAQRCPRPPRAGTPSWASTSSTGTTSARRRPAPGRAGVRPVGVPARLRGVRLGPRAGGSTDGSRRPFPDRRLPAGPRRRPVAAAAMAATRRPRSWPPSVPELGHRMPRGRAQDGHLHRHADRAAQLPGHVEHRARRTWACPGRCCPSGSAR